MKIYYSIKGKGGIYCDNSFGPTFGNSSYFHFCFQYAFSPNINKEDNIRDNLKYINYQYDESQINKEYIIEGNHNFNLKDYEVYELSLN